MKKINTFKELEIFLIGKYNISSDDILAIKKYINQVAENIANARDEE